MKNIYQPFYQRILLFCVLLLCGQLAFAQQPAPPTLVTTSQIVNVGDSLTLQASCATGTLKWYEDVLATPALSVLTFAVTETKKYIAVCETACGCGGGPLVSNPVEILITANKPTNVSTDKSICSGDSLDLSALCPSGIVTWYDSDTVTLLTSFKVGPTASPGPTSYFVSCIDGTYESPKQEVKIYVNSTPPHADPSVTTPIEGCLGGTVTLSATCTSGIPIFYAGNTITEISPTLTNLAASDSYFVRCESTADCPSGFVEIHVNVTSPLPPTIVTLADPVCLGSVVVLDATCDTGSDPKWYLSDGTTAVVIPNVIPSANTTYKVRCESNIFTNCYSTFDSLTVTVLTNITAQPSSVLVCVGDNATFGVGFGGTPTFQWQKRKADGTYEDISLATSDTLTITNTTLADKGYYRCRVIGDTCDFYTEDAYLTFPETIQFKNKVAPSSVLASDEFGNVVAISNGYAIVGAPGKSMDSFGDAKGGAYIYKMGSDGKWAQSAQLTPVLADLLVYGDFFGSSVAISGDYAFVGAPYKNSDIGAVFVFKRQANNTWTQVSKLVDPTGVSGDYFGEVVSVDGDYLAVSQAGYDKVFIYKKDGSGNWLYDTDVDDPSLSPSGSFGTSLGISENTLAVGTPGFGSAGAVLLYERDIVGTWQFKDVLVPSDLSPSHIFGYTTAISGNTLMATSIGFAGIETSIQIYERNTLGTWVEKDKLISNDLPTDALMGFSLSVHNNIAIAGAPFNSTMKGAAVVFEKNTSGDWVQKEIIMPDDLTEEDGFGGDVVTDGKTILIGSTLSVFSSGPFGPSNKGAGYFYNLYTAPELSLGSVAQASGVCSGKTATFNLTGLPISDTFTITYKIDAGGADKTVVVTADASGNASFTELLTSTNNTGNINITKIKNNTTGCEKTIDVNSEIALKAPTIITGHPTPTAVCVGETAVFTGEATGEGILVFQWQRQAPLSSGVNGPLNNDFSDLSVLTLPNRTVADNGATYRVKVTGECGVAISNEAILNVLVKATASIAAGGPICPGTSTTLTFTGTPYAEVFYQANGNNMSVLLNSSGIAMVTTLLLTSQTTFNLISISVEGKCSQLLSGSAVVDVLTAGSNPALTLTSPAHDVLPNGRQLHAAQTIDAINKIERGGKATYIGNKSVILQPGFEAKEGSVYTAKISGACI